MKDKLKVKLVKSTIGCTDKQKACVNGLGLKRIGQEKELLNVPEIRGMVKKVIHLLKVN